MKNKVKNKIVKELLKDRPRIVVYLRHDGQWTPQEDECSMLLAYIYANGNWIKRYWSSSMYSEICSVCGSDNHIEENCPVTPRTLSELEIVEELQKYFRTHPDAVITISGDFIQIEPHAKTVCHCGYGCTKCYPTSKYHTKCLHAPIYT